MLLQGMARHGKARQGKAMLLHVAIKYSSTNGLAEKEMTHTIAQACEAILS